jgi:hypothetical protein
MHHKKPEPARIAASFIQAKTPPKDGFSFKTKISPFKLRFSPEPLIHNKSAFKKARARPQGRLP